MKYILLICILCLFGCDDSKPFVAGENVYIPYTKQIGVLLEITDRTISGTWAASPAVRIQIKYLKDDGTESTKIVEAPLSHIEHYQEPKAEK